VKRFTTHFTLALSLAFLGCSSDSAIDVVIDNPTAFNANVDVTGSSRDGWVGLATVEAGSETTVQEVLDQGDTWIFRAGYSGYEQEIELSREELERARWRVTIPATFESELRQRGIQPPP
jgi:hypothetical protein